MATHGGAVSLAKVQIINENEEKTSLTAVLQNEDHTLGNSLRYILMRCKDVAFCGYTVPHPSEQRVHLRLQTTGKPATVVLKEGLETLVKMCDHLTEQASAAIPADN
eukprot:INCI8199.1.p1 GENE.INCI8199.1~~INCI8199.1.p1  ORF type:complete len:107 (-),score=17.69 INCI8199.1:81-401(-)